MYLSYIFFSIWPLAYVSGPFLSDFFVSFIALNFVIISIKNRDLFFFKNKFFLLGLFFYFCIIISSLFSRDIYFSLESSLFYFRFIFFAFGVAYLLIQYQNSLRNFAFSIIIAYVLLFLDGFYEFFNGSNTLGHSSIYNNRISSFFLYEYVMGSFVSRFFPILLIALLFMSKYLKNYKLTLLSIGFFISLPLVVISGERTAIFYIFLSIFIFLLNIRFQELKKFLPTIIISFSIVISMILINPEYKNRFINTTINQLTENTEFINTFSEGHKQHFISAIKIFKQNPIIGSGPKMFRILCSEVNDHPQGCTTHPHHTYVQLLSEVGILGSAIIFLILIIVFKEIVFLSINRNKSYYQYIYLLSLTCLLISLWPFTPSASFFNNWINGIYYLPIGFILYSKHQIKKGELG